MSVRPWTHWLRGWRDFQTTRRRRQVRPRYRFRPMLEILEARIALSTVTSFADSGVGSLRAAIAAANPGDTINFASTLFGQTISLKSALVISNDLTIDGGTDDVTISGGNATRLFDITAGTVAIKNLTLTEGQAADDAGGGAIFSSAESLTLTNCLLSNNADLNNNGGAIEDTGSSLSISGCTFLDNTAARNGGAIDSPGINLGITGTTFNGNVSQATDAGTFTGGGALSIGGGTVNIGGSTFEDNSAGSHGGAINNNNAADFTIQNSTFEDNFADLDGGGIRTVATLAISGSTISDNSAGLALGAGANGGGIENTGFLTVTNCTIAGNSANFSGGGINNDSVAELTNVTIVHNQADSDDSDGGSGGGLQNNGSATLTNTIVAENLGTGGAANDVSGALNTASSFNLIGVGGSGGLENGTNSNLVGVADPGLATLSPVDNGGPTTTIALLAGSPAIDAGTSTGAPDIDQRGATRVSEGVDIGAYQFQTSAQLVFATPPPDSVAAGSVIPVTVAIEDSNGNLVVGDDTTVTVTLTPTFPGGTPEQFTAQAVDGIATFTKVVADTAGTYTVSASDGVLEVPGPVTLTITPSSFADFLVTDLPVLTTAGVSNNLTLTAQDEFGNVITNFAGSVTLSATDSRAAFTPGSFTFDGTENGTHTFGVTLFSAGFQTIFIASPALDGPQLQNVIVSPAAPASLEFENLPATATAGLPVSFSVRAFDAFGNDEGFNLGDNLVATATSVGTGQPVEVDGGSFGFDEGGATSFEVSFPSGGDTLLQVTDSNNPSVFVTQSIQVASIIHPTPVVVVAVVNQPFLARVATFTTDFAVVQPGELTAEIDWGDHSPPEVGTIVPNDSGGFDVYGTHTYSTITNFLVNVTISDTSRNTREQTTPSAAVVLTPDQNTNLSTFGFERSAPGAQVAAAATPDSSVAAALSQPNTDNRVLTLFVADYSNNPEPDNAVGDFYDARVTGVDSSGRLTVDFSYANLPNFTPTLEFFDATTGKYVPVQGGIGGVESVQIITSRKVLEVVFDANSFPTITSLNGTVFAVSVGDSEGASLVPFLLVQTITTPFAGPGQTTEALSGLTTPIVPSFNASSNPGVSGVDGEDELAGLSVMALLPKAPSIDLQGGSRMLLLPSPSSLTLPDDRQDSDEPIEMPPVPIPIQSEAPPRPALDALFACWTDDEVIAEYRVASTEYRVDTEIPYPVLGTRNSVPLGSPNSDVPGREDAAAGVFLSGLALLLAHEPQLMAWRETKKARLGGRGPNP